MENINLEIQPPAIVIESKDNQFFAPFFIIRYRVRQQNNVIFYLSKQSVYAMFLKL